MTFPLKLTAMEQYMLADDTSDYPMVFFFRLSFSGALDRTALTTAIETAAARHPLLQATIKKNDSGQIRWVAAEQPRPTICWCEDSEGCEPANHGIDLSREIGLRAHVSNQGDETSVLLVIHHACCDGLGALRYIEDLLAAYDAASAGDVSQATFRHIDPERIAGREKFGMNWFTRIVRLPLDLLGLIGSLEYFTHKPLPLGPVALGDEPLGSPGMQIASRCHVWTPEQSKALRAAARASQATLNDQLVRDMFLALQDWLDAETPEHARGHLRVMVPVSLRVAEDDATSAVNIVSMVNLDRKVWKWKRPERLLKVLHWEMWFIKQLRIGITMIRLIQVIRGLTGRLDWLLPRGKCVATCVLSNLGVLMSGNPLEDAEGKIATGGLKLERVEILPPIRPLTRVGCAVFSYAGSLTISMHYDRRTLGEEGGEQLLEKLVARIDQSLKY